MNCKFSPLPFKRIVIIFMDFYFCPNFTYEFLAGTVPTASSTTAASHLLPPSSAPIATLPQLLSQPQPVAMPQFILTSGQLVQGIQGAQLLIPTSQGK